MADSSVMIRFLALLAIAFLFASPTQAAPTAFDQHIAAIRAKVPIDPAQALADAEKLRAMPRDESVRAHEEATIDWLRAEALLSQQKPLAALNLVRAALDNLRDTPGEFTIRGDLFLTRAGAAVTLGRVQDALQDEQTAYRLYGRAGNARAQAKALLYIGNLYSDAGDYATALRYFDQSIETYSADLTLRLSAQNNRANALSQLHRFPEAVSAYQKALTYVQGDPPTESLILRNLARAQAEAGQFEPAQASLARAFALSSPGVATGDRPALYGVAAFIAFHQHRSRDAATWIERALEGAANADQETQRDLHHTAYDVFRARGEDAKALRHLELFRKLDDAQRAVAMSTSAALLNARFNFANQEIRIRDLRNEQERAQARFRNRMMLALLSGAAIISTLLLIGFLSIRRSRNQVRAANATLRTTNVALEKALAAKTEFLATTSHEIRTPLNGILGMTQVILAGRQLDPTLRGRIELVHGAGETMKALVDDILDVAKMETGELRIQTGEMDLKRLLEDAVTVWTGQAETKRIGIEFDLEHCPGKIIADEVRLRQIIFNLMSNAIKFTDRGQVRLAAFTETREDDDGQDGDERLVVRVSDSGIGIPSDRLEEIFESFRQVDGGVTRRHGGTGLGLAICRSLARAMGGDVAVASTLGAGSTFTLTLPLERGAAEVARADRPLATSLATAELLMIEPNPLGQGIMRALLTGECAGVHFVADIPAALEALHAGAADHVIAEGSSLGLDAAGAGELAAACAAANARFTLLWREPTPELLAQFADHAVHHVIAKPISAPDLLSEMNKGYGEPVVSRTIAA